MSKIDLSIRCNLCHCEYTVCVNKDSYKKWKNTEGFIQDLMPELSAGERELIISKTCDNCFDMLFDLYDNEQ